MVLKSFENFHTILTQFIFRLQYHWLEKVTVFLFKRLTAEKKLAPSMECRFLKRSYLWKKKSSPDGAFLELKKGGEPCNCRKILFDFHIEHGIILF